MGKIPFKHPNCNGWAIYKPQDIDVENAKNHHIADGIVNVDDSFRPNAARETVCGQKLMPTGTHNVFHTKDPAELRSKLSESQNNGKEVCGICVSHFYADPE